MAVLQGCVASVSTFLTVSSYFSAICRSRMRTNGRCLRNLAWERNTGSRTTFGNGNRHPEGNSPRLVFLQRAPPACRNTLFPTSLTLSPSPPRISPHHISTPLLRLEAIFRWLSCPRHHGLANARRVKRYGGNTPGCRNTASPLFPTSRTFPSLPFSLCIGCFHSPPCC